MGFDGFTVRCYNISTVRNKQKKLSKEVTMMEKMREKIMKRETVQKETGDPKPKTGKEKAREIVKRLAVDALIVCVMAYVAAFVFPIGSATGSSNEPTIYEHDFLIFNALDKNYKVGDMIQFQREGQNFFHRTAKRIAAMPGDTVDMNLENGELTVNGEVLVPANEYFTLAPRPTIEFPAVVPEGCVFVLGDNYAGSLDSRFEEVGMIPMDSIRGTLLLDIPLSRLFPQKSPI